MNKNIQIINLTDGSEQPAKIGLDKVSTEVGAYFLKNIIKEFINNGGDIDKISKEYSDLDWTSESVCDMCVGNKYKGRKANEK